MNLKELFGIALRSTVVWLCFWLVFWLVGWTVAYLFFGGLGTRINFALSNVPGEYSSRLSEFRNAKFAIWWIALLASLLFSQTAVIAAAIRARGQRDQ